MRGRLSNDEIAIDFGERMQQGDDASAASVGCEVSECALYLGAVVNNAGDHFNFALWFAAPRMAQVW